jgi:hypothetical protein
LSNETTHDKTTLIGDLHGPMSSDEDGIPVEQQRAEMLGPDFDPDYFAKLDALIEASFGPLTGEYSIVNG